MVPANRDALFAVGCLTARLEQTAIDGRHAVKALDDAERFWRWAPSGRARFACSVTVCGPGQPLARCRKRLSTGLPTVGGYNFGMRKRGADTCQRVAGTTLSPRHLFKDLWQSSINGGQRLVELSDPT